MTPVDKLLLHCTRLGLLSTPAPGDWVFPPDEWCALLQGGDTQNLLPLVYETVYGCPSFKALDKTIRAQYRDKSLQLATRQIIQTNQFLTLLLHARRAGLDPVVLKGAVVRSLYPMPMLRPSVDEDLLVDPAETEAYHRFLLSEGLFADDPDADLSQAQELSYHKENSPTYIELHTSLFPPDSAAYGDCNALFAGALERTVTVQIEDVPVRTLAPTDHLLYLICHAYKHFLHSGVGIRQVCDIGMFAKAYGSEIDWDWVVNGCQRIRVQQFAAAIFRITEHHLGFEMPTAFARFAVDESDLLADMLSGGLYGTADVNRLHSSTMTLEAVTADKAGRHRSGMLHSVFLPAKDLSGRYPYLRRHPWLLPAAWVQRLWGYAAKRKSVDPAETIRIGNDRISLLREYGIID